MGMVSTRGEFKTTTVSLTDAAATSAVIDKRGYAAGCVSNESGGAVTITWYGKTTPGGTAPAVENYGDASAVSQIVGDDRIEDLPPQLAGVPFLVPVAASGTPALTFHFEANGG